MEAINRDALRNKTILSKITNLTLSVMDKLITEKDDILYKPEGLLELKEYNQLLHSVITRRIGQTLGHHDGEELANKGINLSIDTSSILYLTDVYTDGFNNTDIKIANIVSNNISYIKDSIVPLYKQLKGLVITGVHNRTSSNPLDKFEIHTISLPELLIELDNRGEFRVNDFDITLPKVNVPFPTPTDDIIGYMKLEIPKLDRLLQNTYNDNNYLKNIWEKYLLKTDTFINFNDVYVIDIEEAMALYLLLKGLHNNLPENLTGISLPRYRDTIFKLQEYMKRVIVRYMKMVDRYTKNNMIMVNGKLNNFTLVDSIYRKYINDGGDIEYIIGVLISGKGAISLTGLKENESNYKEHWDRYVKKIKMTDISNLHLYYRQAYDVFTHKVLTDLPYDIYAELGDKVHDKEIEVRTYINGLDSETLQDVEKVTEYIVAGIIFKGYNGDIFLSKMREYKNGDEDLTPTECASLATLELVIQFILTQVHT